MISFYLQKKYEEAISHYKNAIKYAEYDYEKYNCNVGLSECYFNMV